MALFQRKETKRPRNEETKKEKEKDKDKDKEEGRERERERERDQASVQVGVRVSKMVKDGKWFSCSKQLEPRKVLNHFLASAFAL